MKINANSVKDNLLNPDSKIRYFLVYGTDEGLITITAHSIVDYYNDNPNDNLNVVHFDYTDIKLQIDLLANQMISVSLLGGRTIIIINNVVATVGKELISLLQKQFKGDAIVIFKASELPKASNIRKNFEKLANCAAIPCYKPDDSTIRSLVAKDMQKNELIYDSEILAMLVSILPANYMIISNEIEKLAIYKADEKQVTISDIKQLFTQMSEYSYDYICEAVISGDKALLVDHIHKLQAEEISFIVIIRVLINFFYKVLLLHSIIQENNTTIYAAINLLKPPVFFKLRNNVMHATKKFSVKQVKHQLKKLFLLEAECKNTDIKQDLLYSQELLINF